MNTEGPDGSVVPAWAGVSIPCIVLKTVGSATAFAKVGSAVHKFFMFPAVPPHLNSVRINFPWLRTNNAFFKAIRNA